MVKFGKKLKDEIVPEWKEAFVDYDQLKFLLKKVNTQIPTNPPTKNDRFFFFRKKQRQHRIIQIHKKLESLASKRNLYETQLLEELGEIGAEEFFTCLDHQLNKVNIFFQTKENEFIARGESLKNQLNICVELNDQKRGKGLPKDDTISSTISCDEESKRDRTEKEKGNDGEINTENLDEMGKFMRTKSEDEKMSTLGQAKNIRISFPISSLTWCSSTICGLFGDDLVDKSPKKCVSEMSFRCVSKTKLHRTEKMIKGALVELYKGLGYLKTYRYLNTLAFVKILKKFDKVTNKEVTTIYSKVVENSHFRSSDKINKLTDEVEEIFVKHFAENDRKKAMKYLKPTHRKESHSITFFTGLFTGCFVAIFAAYIMMAHISGVYKTKSDKVYMETAYPVLSIFSLLFLHIFVYGCNLFTWRNTRINHGFILELTHREQLKYREVFFICSASMTCVMGSLFLHLYLVIKRYPYAYVQAIPGLLSLVFSVLLVCPFNICYKSSRYRFLRVIRNIIFSPLYKVVMLDSFMADQLCSEVTLLRNLEDIAFYYLTGSYKIQNLGICTQTKSCRDLAYLVSFLPYYWRAMQCARRYFDDDQRSHLYNMGKYVTAMLAAGAKITYEKEKSFSWYCMLVVMSCVATIYQLYWDYVEDWGLFQHRSKNPWLRDELMLRRKSIYFFSMALNLVLRLAWVESVLHYNFEGIDYRVKELFLAALEVIRRGQWNFYRLENEQVNNAGNFRAVKTVPLPFHEVDEDIG